MEQVDELWSTFCYIRAYHPYRRYGALNPHFDGWDGRVLDFKDGIAGSVEWAHDQLAEHFSELELPTVRLPIVIVPGHLARATNEGCPLANLGSMLAEKHPDKFKARFDGLLRHTDVGKLAHGGDRRVDVHLDSINVRETVKIKIQNRSVLLLDDVTTTGNSLQACRQLLIEAGAKRVGAIVLGKTK